MSEQSTYTVVNPATEQPIAEVPMASAADVDAAVARANAAFPAWRDVAPGDRARLLRRFAAPSTTTSRNSRGSRWRTRATRSADARWEAGNVRDLFEYYAAAPERLSDSRSRCPAGSTSPSRSRSASSA